MKSSSSESFDYTGAYHDYYFVCSRPLQPRTEIPRWNTDAIQERKATCPKCSELEKQRAEEQQLKSEGPRRLQYILYPISKAKDDIESSKKQREQNSNYWNRKKRKEKKR